MAAPQLVEAVVARGRTVYVGASRTELPGADGTPRGDLVRAKPVSAGETVKLPAGEVAQLRASGHLVDPNAVSIPVGDGPTFGAAGGPSVKVA